MDLRSGQVVKPAMSPPPLSPPATTVSGQKESQPLISNPSTGPLYNSLDPGVQYRVEIREGMTATLGELRLCRHPESGPACPHCLLGKQGQGGLARYSNH